MLQTSVPLVMPKMPENWQDTICGQLHISYWGRGIPDVSEELSAQLRGGRCGGQVGVSEGQLKCEWAWGSAWDEAQLQGTHQNILDAHVVQQRLITPTSCHGVFQTARTHQILQVPLPSPRLPCSWDGAIGLLWPVHCEWKLWMSPPGKGS